MLCFTCICTAHSNRVTDMMFIPDHDWLISVSRDKTFQFYCTKTGRKLGTYEAQAWCLAVEYPFVLRSVCMCTPASCRGISKESDVGGGLCSVSRFISIAFCISMYGPLSICEGSTEQC